MDEEILDECISFETAMGEAELIGKREAEFLLFEFSPRETQILNEEEQETPTTFITEANDLADLLCDKDKFEDADIELLEYIDQAYFGRIYEIADEYHRLFEMIEDRPHFEMYEIEKLLEEMRDSKLRVARGLNPTLEEEELNKQERLKDELLRRSELGKSMTCVKLRGFKRHGAFWTSCSPSKTLSINIDDKQRLRNVEVEVETDEDNPLYDLVVLIKKIVATGKVRAGITKNNIFFF